MKAYALAEYGITLFDRYVILTRSILLLFRMQQWSGIETPQTYKYNQLSRRRADSNHRPTSGDSML